MKERFKLIPTSHLILSNKDNILLSRRYNTGYEDGNYSVVAGHLDGDETFIQAMVREAKEEAGIIINPEDLRVVHIMHRKCTNEERIDFFIKAEHWTGAPKIMEPHKCDDLSWFRIENLPHNVIPYVKHAIDCIKKEEMYSEHGW